MMSESAIEFDLDQLGTVVFSLEKICFRCDHNGECDEKTRCPVMISQNIIKDYLSNRKQVLHIEINRIEMDKAPTVDPHRLEEVLASVANLCQQCMFHVDKCFLNVIHALIEMALKRDQLKPAGVRPGQATP